MLSANIPAPPHRATSARFLTLLVHLSLACPWVCQQLPAAATYKTQALPLLEKYCYDCHGDGAKKGGLALDAYQDDEALLADKGNWDKVHQYIDAHIMPPEGKPAPTLEERAKVSGWIDEQVFYVDPTRPDPGHTALRRLNRTEYNHTVRDLLFVESNPAVHFPPDDTGYISDNIGEDPGLSPAHMKMMLRAARQVVDDAVWVKPATAVNLNKKKMELLGLAGEIERVGGVPVLDFPGKEVGIHVEVPATSEYKIQVRAAGVGVEDRPAILQLYMDGRLVTKFSIDSEWHNQRDGYVSREKHLTVPQGKHTFSLRLPQGETFPVAIERLHFQGPLALCEPQASPFLKSLLRQGVPGLPALNMSGEDLTNGEGKWGLDTGKTYLKSNGWAYAPIRISRAGSFRVKIKAGAQQLGEDPVHFELRLGGKVLARFDIENQDQEPHWFDTLIPLDLGEQKLELWFTNYIQDEQTKAERCLWIHEFEIEGPMGAEKSIGDAKLEEITLKTAQLLYRRPLEAYETRRLRALLRKTRGAGESPLDTFRLALTRMLVSPKFLFHDVRPKDAAPENGSIPIDEYSLASRLSYYLWSSAPDAFLLRSAQNSTIRSNLDTHIRQMLANPKARAFTEGFAGQWLQLQDMSRVAPDPEAFPEFTPGLAQDMKRETELLAEHILKQNRPAIEFLSADYTFVNSRLAKHYGFPASPLEGFAKVSLRSSPRRGILSHGSLLTLTSYPTRTSPVRRGKFVLEQILGTPPPPAPKDNPSLEEVDADIHKLPIRKQIELHRQDKTCTSCHAFLDPIGLALENFDALGRYRRMDGNEPIDASGQLITGQRFQNLRGLTSILAQDKEEVFAAHLTETLLTYALGRSATYKDKTAVREILAKTKSRGYRFQDLVTQLCQSVPFQRMREVDAAKFARPNTILKP